MSRSWSWQALRYLLVSHIPFMRTAEGEIVLEHLWARDLEGLSASIGSVRIVAPELPLGETLGSWGPTSTTISSKGRLSFVGLPAITPRRDGWQWPRIRSILRAEVNQADLVHSSNLFPPYVRLSYVHDWATRLGKKTIFVIAEDFYDMLAWEWVRLGATGIERWRRHRMLLALDARVRKSAATASLTFLHTPAAVERYRLATRCGLAIRQPGHEQEDVISGSALTEKCAAIGQGVPLVIIAACRHKPLKGLDFLIDAVALLAARDIRVEARIYGDGDLTPQLRALVVRRGLTDHVSFPGALSPGPSLYEAIASGHLCAMAHRTTDFGRAFWDAMVGGSPVIAFCTTASAGTVRDGVDGLLAPLDDVILFPEYYRWMVPGLPDPAFSQAAVLPIGIAFVVGEAAKWQVSVADLLVFGFAFCVGCSEYLNVGYNEAQNLMFDMLTWVIFPYVLGKGRIEPHNLTIPFAKRQVFLMFIISIVSVYEFKMGVTPWKLVLQRFFPWQGEGWVTTFRWGFTRVAGPYGHAILAGVILITGYRIQRWLEWSQLWEPGFKNLAGLPVSKVRMITIGLVFGVLMTMVRGPWIAGVLAAVLTGIGRAKNRWRAVGIIGAAMVVIGTPTVIAFKSYVSVGREGATSVAQESAAYRKELMEKYIDIALERSIWGWGRTTWPKIPGMPSIDNYYLLLALMHGVLALGFLLLIFLVMMTRLFIHSMRSPPAEPRGSCLGFTLLGIYMAFGFSIATIYMGGLVIPLFFLITGWSEGYLLSGRESTGALPTPAAYRPPFRFQRVMV